jgi:hypothetical protein
VKFKMMIALLGGALLAVPALAAQPVPVPPQVSAYAKQMGDSCRQVGGKPGSSPHLAQRGDLNGDGIADWAIDEGGFDCEGAASLFSGSGGAQVVVFIATRDGGARKAFEHGAFGMRMEQAGGHTVLWLVVGGPMCGQRNARSRADMINCDRPLVWDARHRRMEFAPLSRVRRPSRIAG